MSSYLATDPILSDAPNWLKLDNEGGELFWALGGVERELVPENELWLPGEWFNGVTYGLWRRLSNSANLELSKFLSLSTCNRIHEVNMKLIFKETYHIIFFIGISKVLWNYTKRE